MTYHDHNQSQPVSTLLVLGSLCHSPLNTHLLWAFLRFGHVRCDVDHGHRRDRPRLPRYQGHWLTGLACHGVAPKWKLLSCQSGCEKLSIVYWCRFSRRVLGGSKHENLDKSPENVSAWYPTTFRRNYDYSQFTNCEGNLSVEPSGISHGGFPGCPKAANQP